MLLEHTEDIKYICLFYKYSRRPIPCAVDVDVNKGPTDRSLERQLAKLPFLDVGASTADVP